MTTRIHNIVLCLIISLCALALDKTWELGKDTTLVECTARRTADGEIAFSGKDYAIAPSFLVPNAKQLKLEFDLFPEKLSGSVISCFQEQDDKRSFGISVQDGKLFFAVNSNGTADATRSAALPIKAGAWSHVVAEFAPGALTLRVGDASVCENGPKEIYTSEIPVQLGRYFAGHGMRFFQGRLKGLRAFSSDQTPPLRFTKTLTPPKGSRLLANWDFSQKEASEQWDSVLGKWMMAEAAFCQTTKLDKAHPYIAIAGDNSWKDYAVEALVKILPGKERRVGIATRVQQPAHGFFPEGAFFFEVMDRPDGRFAQLSLWEHDGCTTLPDFKAPVDFFNGAPTPWMPLDECKIDESSDEIHLTLLVAGARIIGKVDGKPCVAANRDDFLQGSVGLAAFGSAVAVKRCFVREINDDELTEVSGIELIEPSNGYIESKNNPPVFRWKERTFRDSDAKMAFTYFIEIANDPSFKKRVYQAAFLTDESHRPVNKLPQGTLYWRVRRKCPRGIMNWSAASKLEIKQPNVTPAILKYLNPRHFKDAKPTLSLEIIGNPAELEILLDGKKDAVELSCQSSRYELRPKHGLGMGLHILTVKNSVETKEFVLVRHSKMPDIKFGSGGFFRLDGKPFFPVGTYRDPSDTITDFTATQEAGFNLTHSYFFEESDRGKDVLKQDRAYLDRADALGLHVFLACPRDDAFKYGKGDSVEARDALRQMAVRRMTSSSYLSCDPHEEPDGGTWGLPPRAVAKICRLLKEVDPVHLTHTLLYRPKSFRDFGPLVDVLMVDSYPLPTQDLDMVYRDISFARSETCKPVWAVIQAFDWRAAEYVFDMKPKADAYRPSPKELRCMAYLALAADAKGIIFYWWRNDVMKIREDAPAVWEEICKLTKEIKELTPFIVSQEDAPETFASTPVQEQKDPYNDSVRLYDPKAFSFSAHVVRTRAWRHNGETKLLVVNPTPHFLYVNVAVKDKNPQVISMILKPLEVYVSTLK